MGKLRRILKQRDEQPEDDFIDTNYVHKAVTAFHPHCYVQPLALAEAKHFDEIYAIAHSSTAHGEEEESDA